ncbi:hypothetical protein [Granulicoccus sp. GXG6511]|uniref:hypothetical protein n=1 Tax=Granulicoccus sp. GXG6511 TaxID=3381351 RepID=UPI003D7EE196
MSNSLLAELAARVESMEGRTSGPSLPLAPVLRPLLPRGLQAGCCYGVSGSLGLATALVAEASARGEWCALVGVPEFGAEAAAHLGFDLTRVVLVPDPRDAWLTVVATLIEVLPIVLVRPPARLAPKELARLESRLRRQGTVLVAVTEGAHRWPRAAATLEAGPSAWSGLASGRGHLSERELSVRVTERRGRETEVRLIQRRGAFVDATAVGAPIRAVS